MKTKLVILLTFAMLALASCKDEPAIEPVYNFTYDVKVDYTDFITGNDLNVHWRDTITLSVKSSLGIAVIKMHREGYIFTDFYYHYSDDYCAYPRIIYNDDELLSKLPKLSSAVSNNGILLNIKLLNESIK